MNILMVMDPWGEIKPHKDTSLALLEAAHRRDHTLAISILGDLHVRDGVPMGYVTRLERDVSAFAGFSLHPNSPAQRLADFDLILMRKDPPFDMNYIYATYVLELAESLGTRVVNRPRSLRDCNEKFFISQFPQCCVPTLISSQSEALMQFHKEHQDVIFKPLDGMGGKGIFRIRSDGLNLGSIVETLTLQGATPIMAQRFIPEIRDGDKRILMLAGKPVPYCLARIPDKDPTRGNLAAGGKGKVQPLSERDYWICEQLGPTLKERGLDFVGLDVIGSWLTEINVTSPTCLREIEAETRLNIADQFIAYLEA